MDKKIRLLCSDADRAALAPVIAQLKEKGLRVSELGSGADEKEVVLAVLSEGFFADGALKERLLGLIGAGAENVLPLQLDDAAIPSEIKNALYARNIIPAAGRDAAQIAERIVAALPKKKSRLPLILAAAGVLLLAVVGLLIWKGGQKPETEAAEPVIEEITIDYDLPEGISPEDLEKVRCVVIIGEHMKVFTTADKNDYVFHGDTHWPEMLFWLGNSDYRGEDGADWYWNEDGSQASLTSYDLRFLSLLPNLEELHMALVDVAEAPDLSEMAHLHVLWANECRLGDIGWLAESEIEEMNLRSHVDLSPLARAAYLKKLSIDAYPDTGADLSDFSPPNLVHFDLCCHNVRQADLSGLVRCEKLQSMALSNVPISDLSFIGSSLLRRVEMRGLNRLRDISALGGISVLEELEIEDCDAIEDFSPLSNCTRLKLFSYCTWGNNGLFDASFLEPLGKLDDLVLQNVAMRDLDFLRSIAAGRDKIGNFSITGNIGDYSGLDAFKLYENLNIDPGDHRPLDQIMPYLTESTVYNLSLRRFTDPDLSLLPKVMSRLELDRCGMTDLSSFDEGRAFSQLLLNKCSKLSSLEGIQKLKAFTGYGGASLDVYLCPRLTDWSALDGMYLHSLRITGGYSLPDFSTLWLTDLRLDSVADVTDLEFLKDMNNTGNCNFELVGLDELTSLMPLYRFKGEELGVQPQLAEQAEDLVKAGNFWSYHIEYPQGGWDMDQMQVRLQSFEELETLPPSLLRHVTSVTVAGGRIIDPERYDVWTDWSGRGGPKLMITDRETGEQSELEKGTLTDLGVFSELTGLRELDLYGQPLKDLDGIQVFSELETFDTEQCTELSDASALFTLQGLKYIFLNDTKIDSIQGVQNLPELCRLHIDHTKVSDLMPLAQCDFTYACQNGGFGFSANDLQLSEEDFRALGSIGVFNNINFTNADPAVWIPALADCEIRGIGAAGDFRTNEDLAAFAADHPELESMWFGWAEKVTDLTPLLGLENLRHFTIDRSMTKAIASIEGQEYHFDFQLN